VILSCAKISYDYHNFNGGIKNKKKEMQEIRVEISGTEKREIIPGLIVFFDFYF